MTSLFVYGTLKRGCKNHARLAGQEWSGEARTRPGCQLYDLGDYPGLVHDATDRAGVQGEIWTVDETTLAALDVFEGVPEGLYARGPVQLEPPFDRMDAQTYWYARDLTGRLAIGSKWTGG
jgi:gamma-glutamylaminecyclotransferase